MKQNLQNENLKKAFHLTDEEIENLIEWPRKIPQKDEKGEPIKDTEVSRKSVAAYVYHLIKYPKEDIGKSIGLGKPGTEGDKPSWY